MTVVPAKTLAAPFPLEQLFHAGVWAAAAGVLAPWCMLVSHWASTDVDEPLLVLLAHAAWITVATRGVQLASRLHPTAHVLSAIAGGVVVLAAANATARGELAETLSTYSWVLVVGVVLAVLLATMPPVENVTSTSGVSPRLSTLNKGGIMTEHTFLERDADLLATLSDDERRGLEITLTSHAIEGMEPTREHTAALVDYTRGAITFDEYVERVGMTDLAQRAAAARAAGE